MNDTKQPTQYNNNDDEDTTTTTTTTTDDDDDDDNNNNDNNNNDDNDDDDNNLFLYITYFQSIYIRYKLRKLYINTWIHIKTGDYIKSKYNLLYLLYFPQIQVPRYYSVTKQYIYNSLHRKSMENKEISIQNVSILFKTFVI